jgi:ATP-dependent Clp protease protease subunit
VIKMSKLLEDLMKQYGHSIDGDENPRGPVIYDEDNLAYNPQSLLLKTRIVRFGEPVMPNTANRLKDMLLMLDELQDEEGERYKDIFLYLDSPGGSVYACAGIVSTMEHILSPINVVCDGIAMSAGSVILAMGTVGKRYALPHATVMVHEATGMDGGRTSDRDVNHEQLHYLEEQLGQLYVDRCAFDEDGYCRWNHFTPEADKVVYSEEPVNNMTTKEEAKEWLIHGPGKSGGWWDHDRFMTPEIAQKWGIVDHIVKSKKEIPAYKAIIEEREKKE